MESLLAKIYVYQAKPDATLKEIKAGQDTWIAEMGAWRKETTAYQVETEALSGEYGANLIEDRGKVGPASNCRAPPKAEGRTQGDGGSRKKLAACRGMTRHVGVAQRKGHCFKGQDKDKTAPRTQKGRAFGTRRLAKPERVSGIRN
jgi:hypothetical protein